MKVEKNVRRASNKQPGGMKPGVSRARNSTISQALCAGVLSCSNMQKSNYPHKHINAIATHVIVAATVKLFKKLSSANQIMFTIEAGQQLKDQLRQASLTSYSRHIMMSALRHD